METTIVILENALVPIAGIFLLTLVLCKLNEALFFLNADIVISLDVALIVIYFLLWYLFYNNIGFIF